MEPGEKAWLRHVAATHKCSAGTKTSSLWNHGKKVQEIQASRLATCSADCTVYMYGTKVMQLLYSAPAPYMRTHACAARALDAPRDHAK